MTRVLIVDDHPENLYLLRVLLEGHGFAVDEARHGAEALTRARQTTPDLCISDLLMPVVDGYTLLRHWRMDDGLKRIPFIVFTATYTTPADERLAMALGADAFILKPSEPEPLLARILEVLEQRSSNTLASSSTRPLDEQVMLKEYNEVLVRKLEKKAMEAERSNRELRDEIVERQRTEEKLRDSEERFRATFEQAAVGIAHVEMNGRFARVNDKLCQMTGYDRDGLLQLRLSDLALPDDRAAAEAMTAMESGHQDADVAVRQYRRKDGSLFWGHVVTNKVHDRAGSPGYFIWVIDDITERRLLEDQLRQSQKMEAVGRLAGGVAHDFNNLLTVISGCTELLLLTVPGLGGGDRDVVQAIKDAGERAAVLTRQLLGFSRQTMLQPKVLDLNVVVSETAKMLRRLLGEDIVLSTVLAGDLGRVKVDPGQLDQVLVNLAVNARDAMPKGGKLTIETGNVILSDDYAASHLEFKSGPHVMLAISDTGCGMPPEVKARIFEPFFTTKEVGRGTGLGLAMVFGVVQQSDGCIHVYSEPGKGTTFRIYFPTVPAEDVEEPVPAPTRDVRGTETVLLVEDDEAVRALASRSLRMHGYQVVTAVDGRDALAVADAHDGPLHLVLTDVVMPNSSGPELARSLRQRFPGIKVLFMSGYTDDAVVRHGLLEAEVAFIQKPYTPVGLAAKVREVLDTGDTPASA